MIQKHLIERGSRAMDCIRVGFETVVGCEARQKLAPQGLMAAVRGDTDLAHLKRVIEFSPKGMCMHLKPKPRSILVCCCSQLLFSIVPQSCTTWNCSIALNTRTNNCIHPPLPSPSSTPPSPLLSRQVQSKKECSSTSLKPNARAKSELSSCALPQAVSLFPAQTPTRFYTCR